MGKGGRGEHISIVSMKIFFPEHFVVLDGSLFGCCIGRCQGGEGGKGKGKEEKLRVVTLNYPAR